MAPKPEVDDAAEAGALAAKAEKEKEEDDAAEAGGPAATEKEEDPATKAQREKDAKRAEIVAKVAAAQVSREKEKKAAEWGEQKKQDIEEKGTSYYGEHMGITCDACATVPIFGYRYFCKTCASHDICESCADAWAGGTGVMPNGLNKQVLSTNPADHSFVLYKDKTFKAVVKGDAKPTQKSAPKLKPNDTCDCGSGKKYKKCCMKCS